MTIARTDRVVELRGDQILPQVTIRGGTFCPTVISIADTVPDPRRKPIRPGAKAWSARCSIMGLNPNTLAKPIATDKVFIGSRTNSRIGGPYARRRPRRGRRRRGEATVKLALAVVRFRPGRAAGRAG